jgi:glyoxylase-like metal-dependent hydrolase (beta-lactamase superfamily II)
MKELSIGDVRITSILERDNLLRDPCKWYLNCDRSIARSHLAEMPSVFRDANAEMMAIVYQTFIVRTPQHTILVDTCTGPDKGYPAPFDYSAQPWLDGFRKTGLSFDDIDYVFCTHLHFDHCGWNTTLQNGRWHPTFPRAKYIFHRNEYEYWERAAAAGENPNGNMTSAWTMNC